MTIFVFVYAWGPNMFFTYFDFTYMSKRRTNSNGSNLIQRSQADYRYPEMLNAKEPDPCSQEDTITHKHEPLNTEGSGGPRTEHASHIAEVHEHYFPKRLRNTFG